MKFTERKDVTFSWDEDIAFDISDTINIDEILVEDIVKFCCKIGLFNDELLQKEGYFDI